LCPRQDSTCDTRCLDRPVRTVPIDADSEADLGRRFGLDPITCRWSGLIRVSKRWVDLEC
jgi:hypothetical protein